MISCILAGAVGVLLCGYGHAALSTDLLIEGGAMVSAWNDFGVDTMQELTPEVCNSVGISTTAQLTDRRDNKKYWVTKLPDGQCWMTQNLDYDGGGTRFYSGSDMSGWVSDEYKMPYQYYYTGDNEEGHESIGSYYSYAAAMTVCPSGWKLPVGGPGGDYEKLLTDKTIGQALSDPYYFTVAGYVGEGNHPAGIGELANYRSMQTPSDNSLYTMVLYNGKVVPLSPDLMDDASSVRCVVGEQEPIKETIFTVESMQELTPEICSNTMIGRDKRLTDTRDGHQYWVARLAAGNCWMTQNLDYDGGGTRITDQTIAQWQMSGSPKQYYYRGDWESGHSSLGSYYTIPSALTVCPAGWELPQVDHYAEMTAATGFGSGAALIAGMRGGVYQFLPSGYINSSGVLRVGSQGYWLTSTIDEGGGYGYSFAYVLPSVIVAGSDEHLYVGESVRCMMPMN